LGILEQSLEGEILGINDKMVLSFILIQNRQ